MTQAAPVSHSLQCSGDRVSQILKEAIAQQMQLLSMEHGTLNPVQSPSSGTCLAIPGEADWVSC